MLQNVRVTAFTVSELLKENQQGWGVKPQQYELRVSFNEFYLIAWQFLNLTSCGVLHFCGQRIYQKTFLD